MSPDGSANEIEAAALSLPALLPPGSDTLALASFTYVYSAQALEQKLAAARQFLGASGPALPAADQVGRVLLENR